MWGIKAYVLSESKSGYLQCVCVYYGRETEHEDLGQTSQVVLTLVEPLHKGYDLYVDRTASELLKVGITVTGMLETNRKGVPTAIKKGTITVYLY